jgi:hypothetical protein
MYIVGINGFKRSGKGETGNLIEANVMVGGCKQIGFADKVKIYGARALGFLTLTDQECIALMDEAKETWLIDMVTDPDARKWWPSMEVNKITGRQYLQNVGTEARKIFGADFWVDQVLPDPHAEGMSTDDEALKVMHPGVDWLAITDLRFENEAQRVLDLGGEVWRVSRPGAESDGHASEIALPDNLVTRELDNSGDLDWLQLEVQEALFNMEEGIR